MFEMDASRKDADGGNSFTLPNVLHFLQREWGRFERDRTKWNQEKAELEVRQEDSGGHCGSFSVILVNHLC